MHLQQAFFNSSQPCRRGPNIEAGGKSAYNNVQVGVGQRNKFCKNIISVPLPSVRFFEFEDKKASKTYKKITLLLPNYVIDAFY
ncbi:hypothetical protein CEQ34_008885 [Staphylococcus aureus]|nr:hypothetical protein [Staphylococcus aureus]MCS4928952.1 hypothetical protein [Staphylococcus aureus]PNK84060.1 hypothetical protein CEQ34_008885 [Staphylococcus aureus]PZH72782.1 hypothetical protein C7Q66_04670 [Staphylococcus aureus]PZI23532.1 hypothetical protein C7R14_12830 [Staphylococcus aureus]